MYTPAECQRDNRLAAWTGIAVGVVLVVAIGIRFGLFLVRSYHYYDIDRYY